LLAVKILSKPLSGGTVMKHVVKRINQVTRIEPTAMRVLHVLEFESGSIRQAMSRHGKKAEESTPHTRSWHRVAMRRHDANGGRRRGPRARTGRMTCVLTIAFFALQLPATAQGLTNLLTFKLSSITERGPGSATPIVNGNWTLTSPVNRTATGGTAAAVFRVTSGLGPGNVNCAGRQQNVKFTWIFNRDPTYITTSEPLTVELVVQADSGACAPNNPYMFTSPMGYFQQTPPMDEAQNKVFFQPPANFKNQPFRAIEAAALPQYPGGFSVYLIGNTTTPQGALAIELDYNYQNVATTPLQPPAGGKPGCTSTSWTISPMSGATLYENQISAGGAPCTTNITTKLPVASVRILTQPSHGTLTQTGPLSIVYQPNPGFHGIDQYSFQYCGSNGAAPGCATLKYTVQVQ
jgi:hypothetical protein